MTTQVNGVEITPKMAEVLKKWYDCRYVSDAYPYLFREWLLEVYIYLTRLLIDSDDDAKDIPLLKQYAGYILCIKDDIENFIPEEINKIEIES